MILWWIANILLVAVVAPVVALLLRDVLAATKEIHAYATDALEHLGAVHEGLNASIGELNQTRNGVKSLGASTQQYGQALDHAL